MRITLKRQELRKKLIAYAEKMELDFPEAEQAAGIIADRITEENVEHLIKSLDS